MVKCFPNSSSVTYKVTKGIQVNLLWFYEEELAQGPLKQIIKLLDNKNCQGESLSWVTDTDSGPCGAG